MTDSTDRKIAIELCLLLIDRNARTRISAIAADICVYTNGNLTVETIG